MVGRERARCPPSGMRFSAVFGLIILSAGGDVVGVFVVGVVVVSFFACELYATIIIKTRICFGIFLAGHVFRKESSTYEVSINIRLGMKYDMFAFQSWKVFCTRRTEGVWWRRNASQWLTNMSARRKSSFLS